MDQLLALNRKSLPRLEDGSIRYPRGWFMIGCASEFPKNEVKPLRFFDQHLVAWRSEKGNMSVWSAHCPHLGAHLGISSAVKGESLICPAHGARFDTQGNCISAPRGEKESLCQQLQVRTFPVREVNGLVIMWHDPRGGEPHYEIEVLPEYNKQPWSDWHIKRLELPVHPREVIENIADKAHFVYVHGFERVSEFRNQFYAHMATQHMCGISERGSNESIATYFGPSYQITWMKNQSFESRLLNAHTPIDESNTQLWFGVMLKKENIDRDAVQLVGEQDESLTDAIKNMPLAELLNAYAETVTVGFEQDVAVWRRKLYRTEPILTDGDGPIAKCRKWYSQFYQDVQDLSVVAPPSESLNPHISLQINR